jgi:hypothetical protein
VTEETAKSQASNADSLQENSPAEVLVVPVEIFMN